MQRLRIEYVFTYRDLSYKIEQTVGEMRVLRETEKKSIMNRKENSKMKKKSTRKN